MPMLLEPRAYLIAFAMLAGAVANSVSGMGFGLVCAPLLGLVMAPRQAAALTILLSLPSCVSVFIRDCRSVRLGDAALILVPAAITAPLWAWAFVDVSQSSLARASGVTVLLSVALLAFGLRSQRLTGTTGAMVAGAASSVMTILAAVGSPPVALYAMNAGWDASRVRATFQAIFLPLNVVALLALGVPQWQLTLYVPSLAGLTAGMLIGARAVHYVRPRVARVFTLALAAICATTLLFAA